MNKGQVWIETVIYTLIGLSLIGLVLGLVNPKINEYKDRAVVEQTISSLNIIDSKINEVLQAPGNVRTVELRMRRGQMTIDSLNDSIYFVLEDSKVLYSQEGEQTQIGRISVLTENAGKKIYRQTLKMEYDIDLVYEGSEIKTLSAATVPYKISIASIGLNATTGRETVVISEISGA